MQTSLAYITNKHVYPFQTNTQQRIARRPPSLRAPSDGCADTEASLDWSYPADACRPPSAPCGVVHTFPGSACIFRGFVMRYVVDVVVRGTSVVLPINTNEANKQLSHLCSFLSADFNRTFDAVHCTKSSSVIFASVIFPLIWIFLCNCCFFCKQCPTKINCKICNADLMEIDGFDYPGG